MFRYIVALLFSAQAFAQGLPVQNPERAGFSEDRLARIDTYMRGAIDEGVMVGGLGMIARDGKVLYSEVWGQRDREANLPMTDDTLFRIYSMTKPITGVAVMMLYEEGHFSLNDPISMYIPELADLKLAVSTSGVEASSDGTVSQTTGDGDERFQGVTTSPTRQPTIRDLLKHTAGFSYGLFGNTEVDRIYRQVGIPYAHEDLSGFVAALGQIPLQFDPGSRWHYSVSVDVQGRLVEVVSGMRFGEFLEKKLFEPLGMDDTLFRVPSNKQDRLAHRES